MKFKKLKVFQFTKACDRCPAKNVYESIRKGVTKYKKTKKGKAAIKRNKEKFMKQHGCSYNSIYMKERRKNLKQKGMCTRCMVNKTENGNFICRKCSIRGKEYMIQYNKKLRRMKKK